MFCGFKDSHVSADFGNDMAGRSLSDTRYVKSQLDEIIIGLGELCDGIVQPVDDEIKVRGMLAAEFLFQSLIIRKFIANDGSDNIVSLIFCPAQEERLTVLRLKTLTR